MWFIRVIWFFRNEKDNLFYFKLNSMILQTLRRRTVLVSFFRFFLLSSSRAISLLHQIVAKSASFQLLVWTTFAVLFRISWLVDFWSISVLLLFSFWGGWISYCVFESQNGAALGEYQMEQKLLHVIQEPKLQMPKTRQSKALTCFFVKVRFQTEDFLGLWLNLYILNPE